MTRAIFILCLNSSLHVSRYPDLSARCVSESIYLKRSYVNPSFVMTRVGVSKDRDPEAKSARIPKVSHRERQEDGVGESTEPVVDGEASGVFQRIQHQKRRRSLSTTPLRQMGSQRL